MCIHKCVETIQEIPKLIKRNGLDFILSNKVIIVMYYVKKETLVERGKTQFLTSKLIDKVIK